MRINLAASRVPGTFTAVVLFCHSLSLLGMTYTLLPSWSSDEVTNHSGETQTIQAFVSIIPQAYFVERVGGKHVSVEVLVGPGKSHHTYEPSPRQLAQLARADVYFRIGVPFENALMTRIAFTMDRIKVVDTQEEVPLKFLPESGGKGKPDPHVWMDPRRVRIIAKSIARTLKSLDPSNSGDYDLNLEGFEKDLDRIDQEVKEMLTPLRGREVYVFHPAYGYFLETYGLKQIPIEVEGKEPGPRHLAEIIERMRRDKVRVLFVQPQFSAKTAKTIASAVGASLVTIDPLAHDYIGTLRETAHRIVEGFKS